MLTFTVEELIRFLSNWAMTFFEGAKRSDDIVFSHYYSFFKRPVLVKEHQVESLYVMVQDRDSSDGKKPSFSRFAKWEFGGFIVDSKTIYLASKTIKELLQNSDFIDDMDVFEKLDSIRIPLFQKNIPADPAMFQDKDTVDKAVRNACSAFLFGTRCNEFSNLIRTMYPLNDDDVIHYLSSPSDWAEETSSVITASNGTASRIYYMARLIAIDRMSELFLTFYEHDSADPKDITNPVSNLITSETIKDKVISTWAIAPRKLCNDVEEFLAENCADYSKYRSDIPMKAVSRIKSGRKVLWKNPIFEETKK